MIYKVGLYPLKEGYSVSVPGLPGGCLQAHRSRGAGDYRRCHP